MSRLVYLPIDFDQNLEPKNSELFKAVQVFCRAEFGKDIKLSGGVKVWAAVDVTEADGQPATYDEVLGLTSVAYALDCHLFHIKSGDGEDEARERGREVRNGLMQRAASFIQDQIGPQTDVFVYVAPQQERFWSSFLRLIKATPAHRFIVRV